MDFILLHYRVQSRQWWGWCTDHFGLDDSHVLDYQNRRPVTGCYQIHPLWNDGCSIFTNRQIETSSALIEVAFMSQGINLRQTHSLVSIHKWTLLTRHALTRIRTVSSLERYLPLKDGNSPPFCPCYWCWSWFIIVLFWLILRQGLFSSEEPE